MYDNSDYVPAARLEDSDMRVLLFKLEKIGDNVADIKYGILKIHANVVFYGDDSSLVKIRPPFQSALRADCLKIGDERNCEETGELQSTA